MRTRGTARWLGLALLGLLVAAAVSIAASRLASQQMVLASQPVSVVDVLVPASHPSSAHRRARRHAREKRRREREPKTTPGQAPLTPLPAPPSTEPVPTTVPPAAGGEDGGGADD